MAGSERFWLLALNYSSGGRNSDWGIHRVDRYLLRAAANAKMTAARVEWGC